MLDPDVPDVGPAPLAEARQPDAVGPDLDGGRVTSAERGESPTPKSTPKKAGSTANSAAGSPWPTTTTVRTKNATTPPNDRAART